MAKLSDVVIAIDAGRGSGTAERATVITRDLGDDVDGELDTELDAEIARVDFDSRSVQAGSLFCCVTGAHVDGHRFAGEAVGRGATALLVERRLQGMDDVPQVLVPDTRTAMAFAADAVSGQPSRAMTVIGVTGTNGKTTTTYFLANIFEVAGEATAVLGTLSASRTTPESPDLQRWLAARRDSGVGVVAMEVSSHALALHRVDATRFAAGVFTNLSRDHLDFHHTMESYFDAKARLFSAAFTDRAVVNLDDPHGRLLRDAATVSTVGFGLEQAEDLVVGAAASSFSWRGHPVKLAMGARFNVSNALAAAETAVTLGVEPVVVAAGLSRPVVVPGRFESVEEGQTFRVIVDYAHTPDALERVLQAALELAGGARVHVVFGCGGERDETKRGPMGAVAARTAHRVVLTADNSRGEPTSAIIEAVRAGFERVGAPLAGELTIEPDRDRAIDLALSGASSGDVVVIAGKGHETSQTIGDQVIPFDDRVVARRHLRDRLGTAASSPS